MAALFNKTCRKCSLALIFLLFLQSSQGQTDFGGLNAIIKRNEKILGKEYVVVIQKAGKNIFLKEKTFVDHYKHNLGTKNPYIFIY